MIERAAERPERPNQAARNALRPTLTGHARIADAIATLIPGVEVVLHDLRSQTVVHIAGNFSRRVIGEPSLLDEIGFDADKAVIGPYEKTNWDGRRIRSISIVVYNAAEADGVLCTNLDVTRYDDAYQLLAAFVASPSDIQKPGTLFKEDWHERINEYIQNWIKEHNVLLPALNRSEKKQLVLDLSSDGAFGGRNAADYIARILNMSRATVYNYLRSRETPDDPA